MDFFIMKRLKYELHNNLWLWNTRLNAFMWQNLTPIYVNFILNDNIFAENGRTFHANPSANY